MKEQKKAALPQPETATPTEQMKRDWKAMLSKVSHKAIVKNLPFLAYVTLLLIFYISNSQDAISTQRAINKQSQVQKELTWKYKDIQFKLAGSQTEDKITTQAANLGLHHLTTPAYTLEINNPSTKKIKE